MNQLIKPGHSNSVNPHVHTGDDDLIIDYSTIAWKLNKSRNIEAVKS